MESSILTEAVQKALKYLDNNELPVHWEKSLLFNSQSLDSESDENFTDVSQIIFRVQQKKPKLLFRLPMMNRARKRTVSLPSCTNSWTMPALL